MIAQTMKINESRSHLKSRSRLDDKDPTPRSSVPAVPSRPQFLEEKLAKNSEQK